MEGKVDLHASVRVLFLSSRAMRDSPVLLWSRSVLEKQFYVCIILWRRRCRLKKQELQTPFPTCYHPTILVFPITWYNCRKLKRQAFCELTVILL